MADDQKIRLTDNKSKFFNSIQGRAVRIGQHCVGAIPVSCALLLGLLQELIVTQHGDRLNKWELCVQWCTSGHLSRCRSIGIKAPRSPAANVQLSTPQLNQASG